VGEASLPQASGVDEASRDYQNRSWLAKELEFMDNGDDLVRGVESTTMVK